MIVIDSGKRRVWTIRTRTAEGSIESQNSGQTDEQVRSQGNIRSVLLSSHHRYPHRLHAESDELFVWGDNRFGKLFSSVPGKKILRPEQVQSGLAIVAVSFGTNHSLCLDSAYNVYTAGLSNVFQYSNAVEAQGNLTADLAKLPAEIDSSRKDPMAQGVRKIEQFDDKIIAIQTGNDFTIFLSCKRGSKQAEAMFCLAAKIYRDVLGKD